MSELTAFLLERIAEDEERARHVWAQMDEWDRSHAAVDPWRLTHQDEYDLLCIEPTRVLAECEAKRQIVNQYQMDATIRIAPVSLEQVVHHRTRVETLHEAVRLLALPYAGHPDYRQEWAPVHSDG